MAVLLTIAFFIGFSLAQSDAECNNSRIFEAMSGCHSERLMLSNASETLDDNYSHLCRAFLNYMQCIEPTILECKGRALLGLNIIKKTYTRDPYNCTTTSQSLTTPTVIVKDHHSTRTSMAASNTIISLRLLIMIQAFLLNSFLLFCEYIFLE